MWVIQRHKHTGCGWWPKRVLWVKDAKEHFALDENAFVGLPGLPTVLCHDSCPPIQSHQSSISTPLWLAFKSQHDTELVLKMAMQNWKDHCCQILLISLAYALPRMHFEQPHHKQEISQYLPINSFHRKLGLFQCFADGYLVCCIFSSMHYFCLKVTVRYLSMCTRGTASYR